MEVARCALEAIQSFIEDIEDIEEKVSMEALREGLERHDCDYSPF